MCSGTSWCGMLRSTNHRMADGPSGLATTLSIVVVLVVGDRREQGDFSVLAAALTVIQTQYPVYPDEIIVPHPSTADVSGLGFRFPKVRLLPVKVNFPPGSSERTEELRAAGVAAASGEIVALMEDHVQPDPAWCSSILAAHRSDCAAIGGAIENGVDRTRNWAIYFTDLGRYQNPLPAGLSSYASLVNVSYKRAALEDIAAVWQKRFNEATVHAALIAGRYKIALSPDIVVHQHWPDAGLAASMQEFFTWGRNYGCARARLAGAGKRVAYACLSPLIPAVLLSRSGLNILRKGRLRAAWFKALPVSTLLTLAWSFGELAGYLVSIARRRHVEHQADPLQDS